MGKQTGWPVYHADEDLTDEMKEALARAERFTDAMRDRYFAIVAERIRAWQQRAPHVVVTQGAYRHRHRDFLRQTVPNLALVCVMAPEDIVLQRVAQRRDGISLASARALLQDFEPPRAGEPSIYNGGDEGELLQQVLALFG